MISFDNTAVAFASKTDAQLNKAYWLFKIIGNPFMVKMGKFLMNFALKIGLPIKGMIKKTIFEQFCGGETIKECQKTVNALHQFNVGTILDYSVEGKTQDQDFDSTVETIIATINAAKESEAIPFAVFKITGITRFSILEKANDEHVKLTPAEKKELETTYARVYRICQAAYQNNVAILIDAEESWIQNTIDRMVLDLMRQFNKERAIVYNTIQMYRHDRLEFLKNELQTAQKEFFYYGVKLVRGAYMEKERARAGQMGYPSPIQANKENCDRDFNLALELIVENIKYFALCNGSHNEHSAAILAGLIEKNNIDKNDPRIYFAQLLGMSDHISYTLASQGYNVAKYVPFGPVHEVMPYLLRRADENTSVAGQTGRELQLIGKERARRMSAK